MATDPDQQVIQLDGDGFDDRRWMRVAIAAARRAEGRTAENPPVGCAIVSPSETLIAVGHTAPGGRPHAETEALGLAGEAARGATAYVTLEPCAHTGQTGPCVEALIEAGISRVVIAARDPDDRVNGRGIERLAEAGIALKIGVEVEAARRVMAGFLTRASTGRPLVTLKTATSLDGMIALADGKKRWITGSQMRRFVHLQRSRSDGILSAIGTVLADDPELTCRLSGCGADSPHRFILDGDLRTSADARLFQDVMDVGLTIFCREDVNAERAMALREAGADVQPVDMDENGKLSLSTVLGTIAEMGCGSLMVEAGGKLASSLLRNDLVDRILWTQGQNLIGSDGVPVLGTLGLSHLTSSSAFTIAAEGSFDADRFIMLERPVEIA